MLKDTMKKFIKKYEAKIRSTNIYLGERSTYRKCLWHQVSNLVNAIECGDPSLYSPVLIR